MFVYFPTISKMSETYRTLSNFFPDFTHQNIPRDFSTLFKIVYACFGIFALRDISPNFRISQNHFRMLATYSLQFPRIPSIFPDIPYLGYILSAFYIFKSCQSGGNMEGIVVNTQKYLLIGGNM